MLLWLAITAPYILISVVIHYRCRYISCMSLLRIGAYITVLCPHLRPHQKEQPTRPAKPTNPRHFFGPLAAGTDYGNLRRARNRLSDRVRPPSWHSLRGWSRFGSLLGHECCDSYRASPRFADAWLSVVHRDQLTGVESTTARILSFCHVAPSYHATTSAE